MTDGADDVSDDLYYTVLRWGNGRGIAKAQGMKVTLTEAPDLGAGPVEFVAYRPEVRDLEVRMHGAAEVREMTRAEERAADALLREMTSMEARA